MRSNRTTAKTTLTATDTTLLGTSKDLKLVQQTGDTILSAVIGDDSSSIGVMSRENAGSGSSSIDVLNDASCSLLLETLEVLNNT